MEQCWQGRKRKHYAYLHTGLKVVFSLSDWSVKWAARKNNGIYEPEFRLFLLIPMFILDIAGYIGWVSDGISWEGGLVP